MISFKQFLLLEGGNVVIDGNEAERIDLTKHQRQQVVKKIDSALAAINAAFKKQHGKPIWNDALFASKQFLSGSAFHFFSDAIDDDTFKRFKSSVGDIDTQVDKDLDDELKTFLTKNKGETFGPATLIGFKSSAGQHISLWRLNDPKINVQIDLEMVDFDEAGMPTEWSQFSHSSAWEDMTKGVKGVAHKYLLRALDAPKLKDVIIQPKTARGTEKVVKSSPTAFSVTHGLRKKLKPVLDANGKHLHKDGKPVYQELSTAESTGTTSLHEIFAGYFGHQPSRSELKLMTSFTGLIELIKANFSAADQQKITDGFAHTLWSKSAQGLYRGDPEKDRAEKEAMMSILLKSLGTKDHYSAQKSEFYANYK